MPSSGSLNALPSSPILHSSERLPSLGNFLQPDLSLSYYKLNLSIPLSLEEVGRGGNAHGSEH